MGGVLAAALLLASGARAECPERASWPTKDWPDGREEGARARAGTVQALEDYAFRLEGRDEERRGVRTDGVLILHHGRVVYERYGRGFTADKRHLAWSVSKSFTSALVGVAVKRGAVALDDSYCKYVKAKRPETCAVTVRHLLEFSSGLDWREDYEEGETHQDSAVLAMLYGEGHGDMVGFVSGHALREPPGTSWCYSSGDTVLLSGVLDAALRPSVGRDWPWVLLFDGLGMRSTAWERDGKDVVVGSSYLYATPRDLAKLGLLYQSDGCWEGGRVLPEGWVEQSIRAAGALRGKTYARDDGEVEGWQWWLNQRVPGVQETLPWPHVPEGAYAARGHWGQSITVIPSRDVIVVRTADDRDGSFSFDTFLKLALAVVEDGS